ncbi:MAG: alpha-L-fucosidase [Bacteroidetes bacterium]|nr:alpha-L-fucosidase [Bacteroidota bacterium]
MQRRSLSRFEVVKIRNSASRVELFISCKRVITCVLFIALLSGVIIKTVNAQHTIHKYYPPQDSLVAMKLAYWQDCKFGLLMHWGTYSQWGIVESWSLCNEDEGWCQRRGPYAHDYNTYKKEYEKLQTTFNPVNFNPDKWAKAASEAGMKYVVFTTKHHDGFCMFDTKQTDYKITSQKTPFHNNPKADVTAEIFNAFRKYNFMTGAYFSKPDWHSEYYWWSYFATPNRMSNYDPAKYPDRWKNFDDYTFNQLQELCTNYGKVDLLWLDGGWVRPDSTITKEEESWIKTPWRNEIDMHRLAAMARKQQPGILIVDRSVYGYYQNYLTPEQQVPDTVLSYPWETCMTMATSWSYVPGDKFKSTNQLIHLLCKIVSRGGNLLLNIAPSAQGDWDNDAYIRLQQIGNWMRVNQDCIYGTKPVLPYQEGKFVFTRKGNTIYAIYLAEENEKVPPTIEFSNNGWQVKNISAMKSGSVKWTNSNGKIKIDNTKTTDPSDALVFKLVVK